MATASPRPLLVEYAIERFPLRQYAPLALLFAAAASSGDAPLSPLSPLAFFAAAALSFVILFQLRLWDDLADIERDRVEHPERALVRASPRGRAPAAIAAVCALTVVIAAALALAGPSPRRAAAYLGLCGALFLWYKAPRRAISSAIAYSLGMLTKYPALVYLASPASEGSSTEVSRALAASLVYLTFCAYEILHDPGVRRERGALSVLAAVMALMVVISSFMGALVSRNNVGWAVAHAAMTVASAIALTALFLRVVGARRFAASSPLDDGPAKGVFLVCFVLTASFTLGIRS